MLGVSKRTDVLQKFLKWTLNLKQHISERQGMNDLRCNVRVYSKEDTQRTYRPKVMSFGLV